MDRDLINQRVIELENILHALRRSKFAAGDKTSLKGADKYMLLMIAMINKGENVLPSEIANKLDVTLAAVTHRINTLEEAGLIIRTSSKGDRRNVLVSLSRKGHTMVGRLKKMHWEKLSGMVEYLGEEDSAKLIELIGKISDYMSKNNI